jgi:hypothetical protein
MVRNETTGDASHSDIEKILFERLKTKKINDKSAILSRVKIYKPFVADSDGWVRL